MDVWFDEVMKFIVDKKEEFFLCYFSLNVLYGFFNLLEVYYNCYKEED